MPGTRLSFGVVPESISVAKDGVVRYVVVAFSDTGAVNAMQEGIRCATGQVKVYARHMPPAGWVAATAASWQPIHDNGAHRHSLLIARTGACVGDGANRPAENVIRALRAPSDTRFRPEAR